VRVPVAREACTVKNVRLNETLCKLVIEEETSITSVCVCGPHYKWREMHGRESNAELEEKFREEFFESEGFDYNDQNDARGNANKEKSVKFQAKGVSGAGGGTCIGSSSRGRESRHGGGYTNLEGHVGGMRKEGICRTSFEVVSMQQEVNKPIWDATATRAKEVNLMVIGSRKARRSEGSMFSVFMGLGPRKVEVEQLGGIASTQPTKWQLEQRLRW